MPTFRDQHGVPMISSAGPSLYQRTPRATFPTRSSAFLLDGDGRRQRRRDSRSVSGRRCRRRRRIRKTLVATAAAAVHERLAERATDAEQQDGRRSRAKEQQELANQSEESPCGHAHLHVRVSQNEVPDVFRQTANSINGRQRHHRVGQLTLPPLLLL